MFLLVLFVSRQVADEGEVSICGNSWNPDNLPVDLDVQAVAHITAFRTGGKIAEGQEATFKLLPYLCEQLVNMMCHVTLVLHGSALCRWDLYKSDDCALCRWDLYKSDGCALCRCDLYKSDGCALYRCDLYKSDGCARCRCDLYKSDDCALCRWDLYKSNGCAFCARNLKQMLRGSHDNFKSHEIKTLEITR